MKKIIVVMMIIVLAVCSSVMAEESKEDLLAMAGRDVLNYYTEQLKKASDEITVYVQEIALDQVIEGKEMLGLKKRVKHFSNLKQEGNKRLRIYELTLPSELDAKIEIEREIVKDYFQYFIRNRDAVGEIRKLFAQVIGQDVKIEETFKLMVFFMFVMAITLFLSLSLICRNKEFTFWSFGLRVITVMVTLFLIVGLLGG